MKSFFKVLGKNLLIIFILTIIVIYSYGFIHEFAHYTSCEIVGLNGNATIDLSVEPPIYSVNCNGINEQTNFSKFLFWGSPYFVSLIIMILFLFYLNKKRFYLLAFPLGIVFNDARNIFGLYQWTYKIGQLGNDLFNILLKIPNLYFIVLVLILGLTFLFFVLNIILFFKEFSILRNLLPQLLLKKHKKSTRNFSAYLKGQLF